MIARAITAVLCVSGCGVSARTIGAVCPGPDGGTPIDASCGGGGDTQPDAASDVPPGTTLAVGLDRSGVSLLEEGLVVGGVTVPPVLRLRGERATMSGWPTESGATLATTGRNFSMGVPAPFTDGTLAVGMSALLPAFAAADPAVGAVGADDFAVEVVLRAAPGVKLADKRGASAAGWTLESLPTGALALTVLDGNTGAHQIASPPLASGAWFHCLFWVSHAAGGRADCDGRAGTLSPLPANLGTLDGQEPLLLGGGGGGEARIALLAIYRAQRGGLGPATGWQAASARRFTTLTGARPSVARGSALPLPGLRDSGAYLDLDVQLNGGSERRVFLVGPDWPRIACRTDVARALTCGFLSEPRRTRGVPASALDWKSQELLVLESASHLPEDGPPFYSLAPVPTVGPHVLSVVRDEIAAAQVFSFFARTESLVRGRLGVVAGTRGMVKFDVARGTVDSVPAGVRATIERWGIGVYRCSVAFDGGQKAAELGIHLLDGGGNELASGDGSTPALWVAGLQLDVGLVFAGSLLAADVQPADRLTFVGDDGNLPVGSSAQIGLRVLLPAGPRLTDQAILNLNRGGTFDDQVQLFVVGDKGVTKFWGLRGGDTYWTFDHPTPVIDGLVHTMRLSWDATTARVDLDGVVQSQQVLLPNDAPFPLNRIDVGFSAQSSGALEGLVGGLTIGAAQ